MQPANYLPLVSREHLSEEDHALILQKMVNGNIATKEEIVDALDKDEYNSMTATYFLLAERKLRAQRQHQAELNKQQQLQQQQQQQPSVSCVPSTGANPRVISPFQEFEDAKRMLERSNVDVDVVGLDCNAGREAFDHMRITQCVVGVEEAGPAAAVGLEQPDTGTAELLSPLAQVQCRRGRG